MVAGRRLVRPQAATCDRGSGDRQRSSTFGESQPSSGGRKEPGLLGAPRRSTGAGTSGNGRTRRRPRGTERARSRRPRSSSRSIGGDDAHGSRHTEYRGVAVRTARRCRGLLARTGSALGGFALERRTRPRGARSGGRTRSATHGPVHRDAVGGRPATGRRPRTGRHRRPRPIARNPVCSRRLAARSLGRGCGRTIRVCHSTASRRACAIRHRRRHDRSTERSVPERCSSGWPARSRSPARGTRTAHCDGAAARLAAGRVRPARRRLRAQSR